MRSAPFFITISVLMFPAASGNAQCSLDLQPRSALLGPAAAAAPAAAAPAAAAPAAAAPAAAAPAAAAPAITKADYLPGVFVNDYTYVITCEKGATARTLTVAINSAFLPVVASAPTKIDTQTNKADGVTISFSKDTAATYTFDVAAPTNLTNGEISGNYTLVYLLNGTATSVSGTVNVPGFNTPDQITGLAEIATDESVVDVLLGIGSHLAFQDYPDYTIASNSVLESTGVGRAIPEILVGAGFTTGAYKIGTSCTCLGRKFGKAVAPKSIFVNVQVPLGSSSNGGSISGYTFGLGYKVQKYLEVLVGYSLAQYNEASPGFSKAAAAVVTANSKLPDPLPIYANYSAADILAGKKDALDGFPLLQQEASGPPGGQIYQGNALINHFRGGLFLGVSYPFSLSKLFQSK